MTNLDVTTLSDSMLDALLTAAMNEMERVREETGSRRSSRAAAAGEVVNVLYIEDHRRKSAPKCCLGSQVTGTISALCPTLEAPKCRAVAAGGRMADCPGCAGCA